MPATGSSQRALARHLRSPTAGLLVAVAATAPIVGYALLLFRRNAACCPPLFPRRRSAPARGQGLARRLIAAAEELAAGRGAAAMRLEVRVDNLAAIRLYEALGYGSFARRRFYYEDRTDALRYQKPLPRLG